MTKFYFSLLLLTFSLFNFLTSSAQQAPCATVEVSQALEAIDPVYARERDEMISGREQRVQDYLNNTNRDIQAVRRISVVVHVVYNSGVPAQNVSDASITQMIQTLNQDFRRQNSDASATRTIFQSVAADAEIEFCLDQTIRVATSHGCYSVSTQTNEMKYANQGGSNAVNPSQFLNIWIVDICGGSNSGTAGYAYLPTVGMVGSANDGLVLDYSLGLGNGNRTATHEIGHYFNLCHTWSCNDTENCSNDDGFSDTPQSLAANYPTFNACFNPNVNSCNTGTGDQPDQTENFMDYATCPNMFTIQQAAEMNSILSGSRSGLLASTGCSSQSGNAPVAAFIGNPTSGAPGTTVQFTDQSTNNPTQWAWNFGDPGSGGLNTSTTQNPTHTYNNTGLYTVTLTATNGNGSDGETRTNYINITTSGGGGTGDCDTIWNPFELATSFAIYTLPGIGYITGNNGYGDLAKAQKYTPVNSTSYISSIIAWFGAKRYTSGNTNSSVIFNIYNMNGTGVTTTGTVNNAPGTVLGGGSLSITQIDTSGYMLITLPNTVTVTGPYAVGVAFTSLSAGDTVALVSTVIAQPGVNELSWEQWSNQTWHTFKSVTEYQGADINLGLIPIECDQLTVDVNSIVTLDDFYIYPNPATNELTIYSQSMVNGQWSMVNILSATGQLVYTSTINTQQSTIDISNLSGGIYFAQVVTAQKTKTLKFIITEK